jgi:hypothetical protein
LNNTNRLLSGDNRGYASYLLEQHFNGPTEQVAPGKGNFVGAFASTNLGVSREKNQGEGGGAPKDNAMSLIGFDSPLTPFTIPDPLLLACRT